MKRRVFLTRAAARVTARAKTEKGREAHLQDYIFFFHALHHLDARQLDRRSFIRDPTGPDS